MDNSSQPAFHLPEIPRQVAYPPGADATAAGLEATGGGGFGIPVWAEFLAAAPTESSHLMPAFWDSPLSHGINVFVGLVLCFTMLGLGCTVDVSQLGEHIRRPVGVLLALVCQFVIMPLVAFLLALTFSLEDVEAMAVLLCGCCPGGNLSNIMSLLVHGEMNLRYVSYTSPANNRF